MVVYKWLFNKLNYKNIECYTPDRISGYGLNKSIIDKYSDCDVIITADTGIGGKEEVAYAKEKYNMISVICDHHPPRVETTPDTPYILDPKIDSSDYMRELSGCAVAFCLGKEVLKQLKSDINIDEIIDIVAISIVADLVELQGYNRVLLKQGLKMMNEGKFSHLGLGLMCRNITGEIKAEDIGFGISPIFNSQGRIYEARTVVDFIISGDRDQYEMLLDTNDYRKRLQHDFTKLAYEEMDISKNIIVYKNDGIPKGLIGLIAGNICSELNKPCIVFTGNNFSARAPEGINMNTVLKNNDDELLGWGSHPGAGAGKLKIATSYNKFKSQIEGYCNENLTPSQLTPRAYYWKEINSSEVEGVYKYLETLEPFGMGCPFPLVILRNQTIQYIRVVGKLQNVLQMTFESGLKGVKFKTMSCDLKRGDMIDVLGSISKNEWNGWTNYQIIIEDYKIKT